jgi:hypothetical protein
MSNLQDGSNDVVMKETTDDVGVEGTLSTAGTFYGDLISRLLLQSPQDDSVSLKSTLAQAAKDVTETTNEPFSTSKLTDEICKRLLKIGDQTLEMDVSTSPTQQESALHLVQTLAQVNAALYLPALAASVHKLVVREQQDATVSLPLLELWIQQLAHSDSVALHAHLLEALVVLSERDPSIVSQSMTLLVHLWENALQQSDKNASIVSVRCATLWIQWMVKLGSVVLNANQQAPELFVKMMKNFDDPLQQLTLMDLLVEHFGSSATLTPMVSDQVQEWLASPALLSPILQMLQDPMLAGISLQYLSKVIVAWRPQELQLVLDHIRQSGTVSNETERLQIVQALSNISTTATTAALPAILQDPTLRHAWWDISRISKSKLQAAVLTSIALALPKIDSNDPSLAMKLYNTLGPDNSTGSSSLCTTQWLLERFVASPIPELRIAAFAILAAMLRLTNAGQIMALQTPQVVQSNFLEIWMDPQRRESTSDARLAYFDVLESLYDLLSHKDSEGAASASIWLATMQVEQVRKVTEKLKKKLSMGPHGREPQRWDVATE